MLSSKSQPTLNRLFTGLINYGVWRLMSWGVLSETGIPDSLFLIINSTPVLLSERTCENAVNCHFKHTFNFLV